MTLLLFSSLFLVSIIFFVIFNKLFDKSNSSHVQNIEKHLSAFSSDAVVADPYVSSSLDLASALYWSRKKNNVLQRALETMKIEKSKLLYKISQKTNENNFQSQSQRFSSQLILIKSNDSCFESDLAGKPNNRLDGLDQNYSMDEKFKIQYHLNDDGLSGFFQINKTRLCYENIQFTMDPIYDSFVRNFIGPDEFTFSLEGPEIHELISNMTYLGRCVYLLPFKVETPGRYHINIVWWRENFQGANDIRDTGWLPMHYDLPLGLSVFIDLSKSNEIIKLKSPTCNLRSSSYEYMHGYWSLNKAQGPESIFHSPTTLDQPNERGAFVKYVINIENYNWNPSVCQMKKFDRVKAGQCLSGKRVFFQGDSHMRQLRNSLVMLVCGVAYHVEVGGCMQDSCYEFDLRGLCSFADGTASDPAYMLREDVDLYVANFGHHFIDGVHRLPISSYKQHVDLIVSRIVTANSSLLMSKLVWYESNAMIFGKGPWVIGYEDQRTNVKIRIMNNYANQKMKDLKIPIIPAFTQTLAASVLSKDGAHYDFHILYQSAAQNLLGLLCPND